MQYTELFNIVRKRLKEKINCHMLPYSKYQIDNNKTVNI